MTPERIAEIYAYETGFDLHKEPAALQDFAMSMYLEGLENAKLAAISEAMFWHDCDDGRPYKACSLIIDRIDALKLPEE